MVACYFAYGSNMNPDRVRTRGIEFRRAAGARLDGYALTFDKSSRHHAGAGHANIVPAPGRWVEGVLYWLAEAQEIGKMDRFEATPVNYSRDVVLVRATDGAGGADGPPPGIATWTYFANPAVRRPGLKPPRSYLDHLLAGRAFLSTEYVRMLEAWPCHEDR